MGKELSPRSFAHGSPRGCLSVRKNPQGNPAIKGEVLLLFCLPVCLWGHLSTPHPSQSRDVGAKGERLLCPLIPLIHFCV